MENDNNPDGMNFFKQISVDLWQRQFAEQQAELAEQQAEMRREHEARAAASAAAYEYEARARSVAQERQRLAQTRAEFRVAELACQMRTESDRQERRRQRHEQKQRAALIAEQQRQHAANRAAELERSRREAERQRQEAAAIAHEQALIADDLDPIAASNRILAESPLTAVRAKFGGPYDHRSGRTTETPRPAPTAPSAFDALDDVRPTLDPDAYAVEVIAGALDRLRAEHERELKKLEKRFEKRIGTLEAKLEKSAEIIDLPALPLRRKDVA
jgi:hypothetical protein